MFDSHIHTIHSHDSEQTLVELCEEAIEKGVKGITVTDHVMTRDFDKLNTLPHFQTLFPDVEATRALYGDRVKLLCGVEISEMLDDMEKYDLIVSLGDYDVILGSVHYVGTDMMPYAKIDFGTRSQQELTDYLNQYFTDVTRMLEHADFDILCHLTCPLRYMIGRYKCKVGWREFEPQILSILKKVIERNISLEINTAGYTDETGYHSLPDKDILQIYYELGGRMLTLGSDSHRNRAVARNFEAVKETLRTIGFEYYCYYEKRKPVQVPL